MTDTVPTVRLRPKKTLGSSPWAFADMLVMDRRARRHPPGTLAVLEDPDRHPLGLGAFNPDSKIAWRLLDRDPAAVIDADWMAARVRAALALRERLFDAPFYRLIHAEADGLPGVIVDRFGDTLSVQPNAAWAEARLPQLVSGLQAATGAAVIYKNAGGRARVLEGLDDTPAVLCGEVPSAIEVPMNDAVYLADLVGGQKTGLFFDQRPNHAFAARLAQGGRMLDVFSHVGGFALAALAAGAQSALAVDSSAAALDLAARGAEAGGVAARFDTRQGDAFDVMAGLYEAQEQFDVVVSDPPAFAPQKPALQAGLRAYDKAARMAARLVAPGGYLVLCSCSHAADLPAFRAASLNGVARAGRRAQILHVGGAGPDHPVHPWLAESAYLKALFLRLVP